MAKFRNYLKMNKDINIDAVLNLAVEAGAAILKVYNDPSSDFNIELKQDNSPLTIADKISHDIIFQGLTMLYPHIPVLSEEGKDIPYEERKNWDYYWCVDPLDGTKEFIKRNGEFTVNIALIHNHLPVFGVIYIPVQNLLYFGDDSMGSWKKVPGEQAIAIKAEKKDKDWTALGSRSHADTDEEFVISRYPVTKLIMAGSSLKFCLIAEGKAQLYFRKGPTMEWDTAAGQAIACFAGCSMKLMSGETMHYNKPSLLNSSFLCMVDNSI